MKTINSLKKVDVYSLMLFVLYQVKDIPEYATLSQLVYVLDQKNLFRFFDYFGGATIKVPTKQEFQLIINALLLYQYVKVGGLNYAIAITKIDATASQLKEIKSIYKKLCEVMENFYVE